MHTAAQSKLSMKEVPKEQFKETYFKLGGGEASGWTLERWDEFFEKEPDRKYFVEAAPSPGHSCMEIEIDYAARTCRMIFLTPESQPEYFNTHRLEAFRKDVYLDYAYEDFKCRFERRTQKYYGRFYGQHEHEIGHSSSLFHDALSSGKLIAREEYFRD